MVHRLRLASGLVLFAFVVSHLLNLSLGIVSLDVMNTGIDWLTAPWRSLPLTVLLSVALLVHVWLAFQALYTRRNLKLSRTETTQYVLGMMIPFMLPAHIAATRGAIELYGVEHSYDLELYALWVRYPVIGVEQGIMLLTVWIHGCIGVHGWLKLKPWYQPWRQPAGLFAILLPTVAMSAYVARGVEVMGLARDPAWLTRLIGESGFTEPANDFAFDTGYVVSALFVVALIGVFFARSRRQAAARRIELPVLTYGPGRTMKIAPGATVLETIRAAGIPHASVCGGRGRCSTCRVRVSAGHGDLPEPIEPESRVLARIGAPPSVRLACQLRPTSDLEVTPMLPPTATARDGWGELGTALGQERDVVILFADMRDFTAMSQSKMPFDVVFVMNGYFTAMGEAIRDSGGQIDKFIGDGVMALFGVTGKVDVACRQAIEAARRMSANLADLNRSLVDELERPLAIGIGIHVGQVIVGEMGDRESRHLTAIGDAVNVASRLETMTKELKCELVLSDDVVRLGRLDGSGMQTREMQVRGLDRPLTVHFAKNAAAVRAISPAPA